MIRLIVYATAFVAGAVAGALAVMLLPAAEPGRWHVRDDEPTGIG